ncbi:FAD-dependent monooxygenase [Kutzneria chonburiensis]|uniref:FAD-dependent monooxygenase n=1 Tax=Kutzneria chonburiensis TaxID=1483604 RepID=A0ABV6MRX3_9PSEU|nr:FAD-dependent monooxygenase [Kutzneria chonburiensis]
MNSDSIQPVVVVGAGPVGLWTAMELALGGVPTVILERAVERSPHSKALGVQPRTLEVLAMRGLVQPFLDEGRQIPNWHFGMLANRLDYQVLDTPFPFMLAIPQLRTEQLFEQRAVELGVQIRRGHAVTGLDQDDDRVRLHVDGPDGPYTLATRYVVGADGVGSAVRTAAGIAFPGTETTAYHYLGEVHVTETPVVSAQNEHGAFISVRLADGRYRFAGTDAHDSSERGPLTMDMLRTSVARVAGTDFGMHDPAWLSRFGNATRLAEHYRKGRVLLAGDAAHRHVPAGGVGLNVGVQDAMNLGWRLAAVARGDADPSLLDGFHEERHAVGEELIEHTMAQAALISATTPETMALRSLLNTLLADVPELALTLARKLSGLDVTYQAGPRVRDHVSLNGRPVLTAPEPGPETVTTAADLGIDVRVGPDTMLIRPDGHIWLTAADDHATAQALRGLGVRFSARGGDVVELLGRRTDGVEIAAGRGRDL